MTDYQDTFGGEYAYHDSLGHGPAADSFDYTQEDNYDTGGARDDFRIPDTQFGHAHGDYSSYADENPGLSDHTAEYGLERGISGLALRDDSYEDTDNRHLASDYAHGDYNEYPDGHSSDPLHHAGHWGPEVGAEYDDFTRTHDRSARFAYPFGATDFHDSEPNHEAWAAPHGAHFDPGAGDDQLLSHSFNDRSLHSAGHESSHILDTAPMIKSQSLIMPGELHGLANHVAHLQRSSGDDDNTGMFGAYDDFGAAGLHSDPYQHSVQLDRHPHSSSSMMAGLDGYTMDANAHQHRSELDTDPYSDLLAYQQSLDSNADLSEAERLARWTERTEFETLSGQERMRRWQEMDFLNKQRLGVTHAFGGTDDYLRNVNFAYGDNWTMPYALNDTLSSAYGSYLQPSYLRQADYIDRDFLDAADIASFGNQLRYDESLAEEERKRRWQQRQAFEALNFAEQARRWNEMSGIQRLSLGLGSDGYASYRFGDPTRWPDMVDPRQLQPLRYSLSSRLRNMYSPFLGGSHLQNFSYNALAPHDRDLALAAFDLIRFENNLQRMRISDAERRRRWEERLAWQSLNEAQRRERWRRMRNNDRAILGLTEGFWNNRYRHMGLGYRSHAFDPRSIRSPHYRLPRSLAQRLSPYHSQILLQHRLHQREAIQRAAAANESLRALQLEDRRNKQLLDKLDRERALGEGRFLSARTWRA